MKTLTKQQIERQDFVDNEIFEMIQKLLPDSKQINWDIETIGTIRESVRKQIVESKKIMLEQEFYPSL